MRTLKVMVTGGAVPTLVATMLAPAVDLGCGGTEAARSAGAPDACGVAESGFLVGVADAADGSEASESSVNSLAIDAGCGLCPTLVPLPAPGTPADPGQLCAVTVVPAVSNEAARVTLEALTSTTATGFVAFPSGIE